MNDFLRWSSTSNSCGFLPFGLRTTLPSAMIAWICLFLLPFIDHSLTENVEGCFNKNFTIFLLENSPSDPADPSIASIYFSSSIPAGPQRAILQNGKVLYSRYNLKTNQSGVYFEVPLLTSDDQGVFSVTFNDTDMDNETYTLTVTECATLENLDYGTNFSILLVGDFMEYTRSGSYLEPVVLWNISDPAVGERGVVSGGYWVAQNITQSDQGNYTLRSASGKRISTTILIVTETKSYDSLELDEDLIIDLPFNIANVTLLFHPEIARCNVNHYVRPRVLVRDGKLVLEERQTYEKRLKMYPFQVVLKDFQIADLGSYHVHDQQGNLATTVVVDLIRPSEAWKVALAPTVGFVFILLLYWKGKGRASCFKRITETTTTTA